MEEKKICVDIVLKREELVQHVRDAAYVIARSASAKSERPSRDNNWLIDIFQSTRNGGGNEELATRAMDLAESYVEMKLSDLTKEDECVEIHCHRHNFVETDELEKNEGYTIRFWVPESISHATLRHIKDLAHEMLVYFTLLRWCELVGEPNIDYLQNLCETIDKNLQGAIIKARGAIIRPMFPIW